MTTLDATLDFKHFKPCAWDAHLPVGTLTVWREQAMAKLTTAQIPQTIIDIVGVYVGWGMQLVPRRRNYRTTLMHSVTRFIRPIPVDWPTWWYDPISSNNEWFDSVYIDQYLENIIDEDEAMSALACYPPSRTL
jgi:hypothetical protein